MGLRELGCENVDWIQLGQERVKWRIFVNMNLLVPQKHRISRSAE
jgi:hypothetical protein